MSKKLFQRKLFFLADIVASQVCASIEQFKASEFGLDLHFYGFARVGLNQKMLKT